MKMKIILLCTITMIGLLLIILTQPLVKAQTDQKKINQMTQELHKMNKRINQDIGKLDLCDQLFPVPHSPERNNCVQKAMNWTDADTRAAGLK